MSFLSRLFGSKPSPKQGGPDIEEQLSRLEAEAEQALPGYVGSACDCIVPSVEPACADQRCTLVTVDE